MTNMRSLLAAVAVALCVGVASASRYTVKGRLVAPPNVPKTAFFAQAKVLLDGGALVVRRQRRKTREKHEEHDEGT